MTTPETLLAVSGIVVATLCVAAGFMGLLGFFFTIGAILWRDPYAPHWAFAPGGLAVSAVAFGAAIFIIHQLGLYP